MTRQMTAEQVEEIGLKARDELVGQIKRYKLPVRFVAVMLDVSPPTVHSWCSGKSLPTSFQAVTNALRLRQYIAGLPAETAWKLAAQNPEGKAARAAALNEFIGPA